MPSQQGKRLARVFWTGVAVFVLALTLRILFLEATGDSAGAFSPYYKGDTPTWLGYAGAIRSSSPFDLGLPMRPPGVAWLVALAWNGQEDGFALLRVLWSIGGAAVVALFFVAVFRSFGLGVAAVAGGVAATSTGLMILSNSPNNEIPYLLLVMGSLSLWEPVRQQRGLGSLLGWSMLNGAACLIRVEHVLFFALVSAYLVWAWGRSAGMGGARGSVSWRGSLGRGALMAALFLLPLVPWHLYSWAQIERFNNSPLPLTAATEQAYTQLEHALAGMPWTEGAVREKQALPAFSRRPLGNFVAATVAVRGGNEVTAADFRIIEEAFGSRPGPIAGHPFVALYGGLNFHLANNRWAAGGFTRAPLEVPPPLAGGPQRYPAFLVAGLPPPDLAFSYPPHVEIVNEGYRLGREWILRHPADYLNLAWRKVTIFWSGVSLGFTGYNLPLGMSGVRRAVDLVVPEGGVGVGLWRGGVLAAMLLGLWGGRREEALLPWLLLLATKLTTTVAFFGYAREGAVLIPVFALSLGLLARQGWSYLAGGVQSPRKILSRRAGLTGLCLLAAALVAVEAFRWHSNPVVTLDGREVGAADPYPGADYEERRLQVLRSE
jgi:hypothetical protein